MAQPVGVDAGFSPLTVVCSQVLVGDADHLKGRVLSEEPGQTVGKDCHKVSLGHFCELSIGNHTSQREFQILVKCELDLAEGCEREERLRCDLLLLEYLLHDLVDVLVLLSVAHGGLLQLGTLAREDHEAIGAFKHLH